MQIEQAARFNHYHYRRHHHHYPKCHLSIQRNQRHREKDCRQIKETAPANGSPEPIERVDNLRWSENDNDNFYDDLRIMINDDDNFYVDGQLDHRSPHLLTNGCDSGVVTGGQWGAETNLSIYPIMIFRQSIFQNISGNEVIMLIYIMDITIHN